MKGCGGQALPFVLHFNFNERQKAGLDPLNAVLDYIPED